jgi:acetyl esterase/lipase
MPRLFAIFGLFLVLSLPGPLAAQVTAPYAVDLHPNLEYANVGGHSLRLDLYLPKGATQPVPLIIWIHGGGWSTGSKSDCRVVPLVPTGFAVASIDYRMSQEAIFPAQIYDCKAAVRWLRANAATYHLDPTKFGAGGDSAGGHLVALLGTTAHPDLLEGNEGNPGVSSEVQAVVDLFGPTDLAVIAPGYSDSRDNAVAHLLGGPVDEKMDLARQASPVTYVNARSAPFYIANGDADTVVPVAQSVELNAALQKAGVPSTLHIVPGGGHEFNDDAVNHEAIAFLTQYLMGHPATAGH